MTDGQVKYQTLMENQRHNYEMERLGSIEARTKESQAESAAVQAQASLMQAQSRKDELKLAENKHGWDIAWHFASFLIPDANTALRSGAQVVSSLFG